MLYRKILVPFDGSQPAKNALEVAKKLISDEPEATMYILSVVPAGAVALEIESPRTPGSGTPMLMPDVDSYHRVIESAKQNAAERLDEDLGEALADVECNVVVGSIISSKISDGIVDYARENGCEIIVMGRRGLGALRGMLGSVSYAVLHLADVPVLTVK